MRPGMKILEETLGIGAQVADLERIWRRLCVEKLDLVGHSFGGFI
jgi:pimeloyl-ACP methyl ester carboxylesterase